MRISVGSPHHTRALNSAYLVDFTFFMILSSIHYNFFCTIHNPCVNAIFSLSFLVIILARSRVQAHDVAIESILWLAQATVSVTIDFKTVMFITINLAREGGFYLSVVVLDFL